LLDGTVVPTQQERTGINVGDNEKRSAGGPASQSPVLVTGASGFVAMHCIMQLLKDGYRVRGTVRNAKRAARVTDVLKKYADVSRLSLVEADLSSDAGWQNAVTGCEYVLHVASPVPRKPVKHADELIAPARDGVLRVLRAAAAAKVKRMVMTSSTAAVFYGHKRDGSKTYDERDWSDLGSSDVGPYEQSKTLAERAAWEFVESRPEGERFELVTLQPGLVLGPVLGNEEFSISGEVIRKLLAAELPGCPDLGWAPVDVRDLARAHVTAMTQPEAKGQRFILALEHTPWLNIAQILLRRFGPQGFKVPTRRVPNWLLKTIALFDKTAGLAVPELGKRQDVSCQRAKEVLGFQPRDVETMVVDMADSMIQLGIVTPPRRSQAQVSEAR
jgi:nucleoside-diphosphate-sugar epimerase